MIYIVQISAHDGFPRWVGAGADWLEVDVRRGAGGAFILSHDEPANGANPPTLDAALSTGRPLQLDLKEEGYEIELLRHVLARLPRSKVSVTTADDASIGTLKDWMPHLLAGLTLAEKPGSSMWDRVERCHADFIALDHRYARWFIQSPIPVWLWTVDDSRALRRLIGGGWPAAIITNRPDLALRFRKGRF